MITIMGAGGHTGGTAARALLDAGERVRVLGRSAERLKGLAERGAEVMTGDATDAAHLTAAFTGADAVYALIPPNPAAPDYPAEQAAVVAAVAQAVAESGTPHVVLLSSIGADLAADTGPIAALHALEAAVKAVPGANVLALRPGFFFENHLNTAGLMKHQGINGGAIAPDVSMAMTATADIGRAAAEALAARDFSGFSVRELQGPRNHTLREATRILATRVGRPEIPYVQMGYDDYAGALTGMGISASVAGLFAEMARAFNDGRIQPTEARGPGNTTPTTLEAFADTFAAAYEAA